MTLSSLVIVVAGASEGIGKVVALRAASDGASVVINYLSDNSGANAVVSEIGSNRAIAVQADISKVDEVDRLIDATVSRFGKIDVLIPNAAFVQSVDIESLTEEIFDQSIAVNMVRVLARDLAKKDIRINAVSLGATSTEPFNQVNSDERIQVIASSNPFARIGTPEKIAAAVILLWRGDSA